MTARYDAAIARWFAAAPDDDFPRAARRAPTRRRSTCATARTPTSAPPTTRSVGARTHLLSRCASTHGKELSFNNLLDLDAARALADEFDRRRLRDRQAQQPLRLRRSARARPGRLPSAPSRATRMSAYGGVIALNRRVDDELARRRWPSSSSRCLSRPASSEDALAVLQRRRTCALLDERCDRRRAAARRARGQAGARRRCSCRTATRVSETRGQMRVLTARSRPSSSGRTCCSPGAVCRHVRSNAIVLARDGATIGIGAGQMSRVDAVRIAVEKARAAQPELLAGAVLASDAYFPFADGPAARDRRRRARRSSSPAARCATARSSPPPTRPASRWSPPACATSATEAGLRRRRRHSLRRRQRSPALGARLPSRGRLRVRRCPAVNGCAR